MLDDMGNTSRPLTRNNCLEVIKSVPFSMRVVGMEAFHAKDSHLVFGVKPMQFVTLI